MTITTRRRFLKYSAGLIGALSTPAFAIAVPDDHLRHFITSGSRTVAGIPLRHSDKLQRIYAQRRYIPLWSKNGQLTSTAHAVIEKLENSAELGLHAPHYYTQVLKSWASLQRRQHLELLLTDSLYEYFDNTANGQSGQITGDKEHWFQKRSITNVEADVQSFFNGNTTFRETVANVQPYHQRYHDLLTALGEYQQIEKQGGLITVPGGYTLKPGMRSSRVSELRSRLYQTGDLTIIESNDTTLYDQNIAAAVSDFQQRHGLDADGLLGKRTLTELNVTAEQRAAQIEINLHRWRSMPKDLGGNHIVVNAAGYDMEVTLHHNHALTMNVVVGKPKNPTPVFSDEMEHLVFRPSWNVPSSIAREELLPREIATPGNLENRNFVAVSRNNQSSRSLSTFAASELVPENFLSNYRLRQQPGDNNALGSVKFMFPNRLAIYLHDTPAKSLFSRITRAFSHGCVRVEQPALLAKTLLLSDGMSEYEINDIQSANHSKTVRLNNHVPVHITYQTSWVDNSGKVQFRNDIYGHDAHAMHSYQSLRPKQSHKESQSLAQLDL